MKKRRAKHKLAKYAKILKKAFLISLAVLLSLLCSNTWLGKMTGSLYEVNAMGRNEFDNKLSAIRQKYPHGSRWGEECSYGWQCFGFAHWVADSIFGGKSYGNWQQIKSLAGVKAGDIVQYGNPRDGTGHTIFVTAVSGDTITYADANSDYKNTVKWNQTVSKGAASLFGKYFWYIESSPGVIETPAPAPNPIRRGEPIPGGERVMSDGDYHIVSALKGNRFNPWQKCLTTGGLPGELNKNGANMLLWPSLEWRDSVFTVIYLNNGFYKIKLKDSDNKCLDVAGGDTAIGTNVQQWEDNGSSAQQWRIDERADGDGYTIRAACNGWYLDVYGGDEADGTNIHLWEGNDTNAQKWYFIPWGGGDSAKQELADGEYHIVPKIAPDKALNADADEVADGTNITLWPSRNDGKHTFQVKWLGNGYYEIINKNSGLALDAAGGWSRRGVNVELYRNLDENNKKWLIRSCGDGYFNVITKSNGQYLDLADAKTDNGTNVQLYTAWETYGADCQKWRFIPWGASIGQTIEDGAYQIVSSADDSKTLSVAGDKAENGTNIELNSHKNDGRHTFDIQYLGNGYYNIINKTSRFALDVGGGGWNQASNVQLWGQNMGDAQQWMIKDCGDGTYNIISKRSGLNLDLSAGITDDGTNIQVWERNDTDAQKWEFVPYTSPVVAEAVTLDKEALTIIVGEQSTIKAAITPENASDKSLTWVSSDIAIADVDSQGLVTAKTAGTATITVTTKNGKTASCNVTVQKELSGEPDGPNAPDNPDKDHTHSLVKVEATEANCKHSGNKEYWTCESCGKVYADAEATTETTVEERTIPKTTQHTWDEGTVTEEPTKTEDGERTFVCTVCGEEKTEVIPATEKDDDNGDDELLEIGDILTDEDTGNSYIVTSIKANKRTVAFRRMGNKSRTVFTVPGKVTIDKLNYEVTSIADRAFAGNKKLKSISFGNNIETIGEKAFSGCIRLNRVKLGKNSKAIGNNAFANCKELKSFTIPSKVRKIGKQAFLSCKKLQKITIETKYLNKRIVGRKAFKGVYSRTTVKVPKGKVNTYRKILQLVGLSKKARVKS